MFGATFACDCDSNMFVTNFFWEHHHYFNDVYDRVSTGCPLRVDLYMLMLIIPIEI